jgi:pyoverdine/dityrosine biosynthesis protein Dit1
MVYELPVQFQSAQRKLTHSEQGPNTQKHNILERISLFTDLFLVIPLYLQSVPVHSANCAKTYTVACRRVLSSASR